MDYRATDREFRFGIASGGRFSQYWRLRAPTARPELFIAGSKTGGFLHLTLHEDPTFSHIKVTLPTEKVERPWRPRDIAPGMCRLVRFLYPPAAVRYEAPPKSERVRWHAPADGESTWTEVTVVHSAAGLLDVRNAEVLGGVVLADDSQAVVVARSVDPQPGQATMPRPDPEALRRMSAPANLAALIHGEDDDGCVWLLDLHATPPNGVVA